MICSSPFFHIKRNGSTISPRRYGEGGRTVKPRFTVNLSGGEGALLDVRVGIEHEGKAMSFAQVRAHMGRRPGVFLTTRGRLVGAALALLEKDDAPAEYHARVSTEHFIDGRYELRAEYLIEGESSESAVESSEVAVLYRAPRDGKPFAALVENRFRVSPGGFLRLKRGLGASHLWSDYDFSAVVRPDKGDPEQYPDAKLYPHGRFTSEEASLPGRSDKVLARYEGGEAFKVISVVYEARRVDKDGLAYQCLLARDPQGREGYLWSVYADIKYVEDATPEEFAAAGNEPSTEPAPESEPIAESRVLAVAKGQTWRLAPGLGVSRLWKGYNFEKTRRMDARVDFDLYPNGRWEGRAAPMPSRAADYGAVKSYSPGSDFEVLFVAFEAAAAGTDRKAYQCLRVRDADGREGYLWSVYGGVVYVERAPDEGEASEAVAIKSPVLTLSSDKTYRLKEGMGSSGLWSDYDFGKTARSEAHGADAWPGAAFYPNGRWVEAGVRAPLPRPARSRSVITRYQGGETFQVLFVAYEAVNAGRGGAAYQCVMIRDQAGREGLLWSVYQGDVYIEEIQSRETSKTPSLVGDSASFAREARERIMSADELAEARRRFEPDAETWERIRVGQKALYRNGLLAHHGFGGTRPFAWNDDDWRNLWQLEAVVEFYLNFTDPRRPGAPVAGENKPRLPDEEGYVSVDLSRDPENSKRRAKKPFRGCHMIVLDSAGGRVSGKSAKLMDERKTLEVEGGDLLKRTNAGWDTVYVHPANEAAAGSRSRVFKILSCKNFRLELDRPVPAEFGEGPMRWNIPAGLGANNPPKLDYTLRETTNGYDHYDGVLYVVKDGVVHFRERVSSFTSRSHVSHAANGRDMSLRGNKMYYFQNDPAGGNRTINYAFTLTAKSGYASTRMEARSYFAEPVKEGVTWNLFVHYGYYISNRTGSAGCFTSPAFSNIRDQIIELYQREYLEEYGMEDKRVNTLRGKSQNECREIFAKDRAAEDTWWWSMKAWGNLWLVRPEERPEG